MKKKTIICLCFFVALVAEANNVWDRIFSSAELRYRLTIWLEVDGRVKSASSIVQVKYSDYWDPIPVNPFPHAGITVRGQAVALDLGTRGYLFATLQATDPQRCGHRSGGPCEYVLPGQFANDIVPYVWNQPQIKNERDFRRLDKLPIEVELPAEKLPLLIRFRDISDPATVEIVNANNLAAIYGPGVRFVRASITRTTAPVSMGMEKVVPWLSAAMIERERLRDPKSIMLLKPWKPFSPRTIIAELLLLDDVTTY